MNDPRLGKNATIKDLIELKTLPDPENYLRNVLDNMMACKEEFRTPHVPRWDSRFRSVSTLSG